MAIEVGRRAHGRVRRAPGRPVAAFGVGLEVVEALELVVADDRRIDAEQARDHLPVLFQLTEDGGTDVGVAGARKITEVLRPPHAVRQIRPARRAAQAGNGGDGRDGEGRAPHVFRC